MRTLITNGTIVNGSKEAFNARHRTVPSPELQWNTGDTRELGTPAKSRRSPWNRNPVRFAQQDSQER